MIIQPQACPLCGPASFGLLASRERIAWELEVRGRFFESRIEGRIDPAEQKDRTEVLHATPLAIWKCHSCGILVRESDGRSFESDPYEPFVMERMLREQIEAYRKKESWVRPLLPPHADVIEVGSYVGGFLHVAHEWGWNAAGVDIGDDTARFAAAHSYRARHASLEECGFAPATFDAVFIWNCFEQADAPSALLGEARRIVRTGGLLLIRTPNAAFYGRMGSRLRPETSGDHDPALLALAWSNLLAFPHRFGFDARTLDALAAVSGFRAIEHRGDVHMATMRERFSGIARQERDRVEQELSRDPEDAPWIECLYRADDETAGITSARP